MWWGRSKGSHVPVIRALAQRCGHFVLVVLEQQQLVAAVWQRWWQVVKAWWQVVKACYRIVLQRNISCVYLAAQLLRAKETRQQRR